VGKNNNSEGGTQERGGKKRSLKFKNGATLGEQNVKAALRLRPPDIRRDRGVAITKRKIHSIEGGANIEVPTNRSRRKKTGAT